MLLNWLHSMHQPESNSLIYQHSCLHQVWAIRYVPRKIHLKEMIHIKVLMNWKQLKIKVLWNLDFVKIKLDIKDSLALQIGSSVFKILYNKFHRASRRMNSPRPIELDKEMVLQMRNITKRWMMLAILQVNFTKLYHNQFTINW